MQRSPIRTTLSLLAIAVWAFLLLSNISYSPLDWPSHAVYPYAPRISNLCGMAGAFVAYWSRYAVGPGVYPVLFFGGVFVLLGATRNRISDFWLRLIGITLLAVGFGAVIHCISAGSPSGMPEGNGGVMGIASAHYLQTHFNTGGTMLVLTVAMLVGLILAADDLVIRAPGRRRRRTRTTHWRPPAARCPARQS